MKTPGTFLAVLFAAALPLASCDKHAQAPQLAPSSPVAASPSGVSLTADPNPVPAGEGAGKTTINWHASDGMIGEIYVVTNSNPETLFARGPKGPAEAPWIVADSTYEFRLYDGSNHVPSTCDSHKSCADVAGEATIAGQAANKWPCRRTGVDESTKIRDRPTIRLVRRG